MPLGAPCDCPVAITYHSNATVPFVITTFQLEEFSSLTTATMSPNVSF